MKSLQQYVLEQFKQATGMPLVTKLVEIEHIANKYRFAIIPDKKTNPNHDLRIQFVHNGQWVDAGYNVKLQKVVDSDEMDIEINNRMVTLNYHTQDLIKELHKYHI